MADPSWPRTRSRIGSRLVSYDHIQVSSPQFVLVPGNIPLRTARPDGTWTEFTDLNRWNTRGAGAREVQYCVGSADVALAKARAAAQESGFGLADLADGPGLLDVTLTPRRAYNLALPRLRRRHGLTDDYPADADDEDVRASCRAIGDAVFASGEILLAVPSCLPQAVADSETLAVVGAVDIAVTRRRKWADWCGI